MIYTDLGQCLRRESDGAAIPKDPANRDYQEALATGTVTPKPALTKPEAKASALAAATAAGFSLDQLRVIRAIVLLAVGTAPQKTKAQALLAPLLQLCLDAKAVAAAIDADAVPPAIVPPILGTDDP
jgi:hypothetical protein